MYSLALWPVSKNPGAQLELLQLDLSDFESIISFSKEFHLIHSKLHVLICNAGIMKPAKR